MRKDVFYPTQAAAFGISQILEIAIPKKAEKRKWQIREIRLSDSGVWYTIFNESGQHELHESELQERVHPPQLEMF